MNQPAPLGDFTPDRRLLLLAGMAAIIGILAAWVAWALLGLIALFTNLAFYHRWSWASLTPAGAHPGAWVLLPPLLGGLLIGLMARYGSEKIRGHGIPEALEAILIGGSRMSWKVALLKPLSSALSIGSGGPFGAEGPIIMTGGACGSLFAQLFELTAAERKTLLVAGAAAGMAAVFATPVAAVLLSVELLLFELRPRSLVAVAVASSLGAAGRVPLLGPGPTFPVLPHPDLDGGGLLLALGVGLAAGLGSALLTGMVYGLEDLFGRLPWHWMWWPALGGLAVGLGGWLDPRVLGVGYDLIQGMLRGQLAGPGLAGLLLVKALVWSIALGSGTSGGVLAPLLILGGALGGLEASLLGASDSGLWCALGMAAMMGGTMRSPLTSTVFLLELTHDLNLLPLLLVSSVAAHGVTVLGLRRSILTEKVARRGYHVAREYSVDPLERTRVEEVMEREVITVPSSMTVAELIQRIARQDPLLSQRQGLPVVDPEGSLVGLITRSDLIRALEAEASGVTVLEAGARQLQVAYPEEVVKECAHRLLTHGIGRLPVVSRQDPTRLVGYLGRAEIISARLRALEEEVVRG